MFKSPSLAILLCCLTFGALKADQPTVVVSPNGPISTLNDARLKVRELKKKHPGQSIEVMIKGGAYSLTETVVFGLEDSGTEGAPVIYKAAPGETPVFSGGIRQL